MNATWLLQDAKNNLSEVEETALRDGAQIITRNGKPVVVVLSAEAFARFKPSEKLVEIHQDCPAKKWQVERDLTPARDLDFKQSAMAYLFDNHVLCESSKTRPDPAVIQ